MIDFNNKRGEYMTISIVMRWNQDIPRSIRGDVTLHAMDQAYSGILSGVTSGGLVSMHGEQSFTGTWRLEENA